MMPPSKLNTTVPGLFLRRIIDKHGPIGKRDDAYELTRCNWTLTENPHKNDLFLQCCFYHHDQIPHDKDDTKQAVFEFINKFNS